MEIIKECGVCGKAFVASKMSFKNCCRGCERVAFRRREAEKKKREKENAESLLNAERNNSLRDKAFLSPEDVSVLFDVSLPTVYRYFQTGLIKAVKIRNKTFVRYSVEKPRDFDPFGQAGFAHLWLQYDCPFKVLVLGGQFYFTLLKFPVFLRP